MKLRTGIMAILIGTGMGWVLSPSARSAPPNEEATERAPSTTPAQAEVSPDSSPNLSKEDQPSGADTALQFESEAYRRATPADREMEGLRLHQNTVRNRFESTDNRGEVLLSFSGGKVDLVLRGADGAEAPVARLD